MDPTDPFDDPDSTTSFGIGKRTVFRIALAACTVVLVAIWFRVPLAGVWPLLWPPVELSGRWFTLLMTVLLSFLVPVAIALRLADLVYDRYLDSATDTES